MPGAGWWQASDGEWYSPQTHPDPSYRAHWAAVVGSEPAPPAPPEPISPPIARASVAPTAPAARVLLPKAPARRVPPALLYSLVVLSIVAVGVAAYYIAGGGSSDELGTPGGVTGQGLETTSTTSPATTSTSAPPEPVVTEVLGLKLTLPLGWIAGAPGSGASGEQLTDDPDAAALFDELLAQQPPETVLFGVDTDARTEASMTISLVPGNAETEAALVQTGARSLSTAPFQLVEDAPIDAGIDGHRFLFVSSRNGDELLGVQYLFRLDERIFIATFSTIDESTYEELLAIGPSFTD